MHKCSLSSLPLFSTKALQQCGLETTSCDREILPSFNFELASEDEKATLEWSITPIPEGGIAATRGELDPGIGFIEESLGTNSGSIFIPGNAPNLKATPFNVSVKNLLGETLSTSVTLSVSQAPENLGVGNLYILTLDSNDEFRFKQQTGLHPVCFICLSFQHLTATATATLILIWV